MKKINILIAAIVLIATTVNAQQDWKDPQCNKKHIIDGSSWDGILKDGSECKCNLMDLWSSQYYSDTTTLKGWAPNNPGIDWKKIILEDTTSTIYHIQLPELECVEFDSLEWNGWSPRKGVKYKGELFTGTACGYTDEKSGEIVEPRNYIEGKLNGYHCSYYKNGNKCFEIYYENGKPMKGKPSTWWNEDGTIFKRWEH